MILGALAGFYGGVIDQIVMRSNDILYSIPNITIAVVIVSLLGTSTVNLLLALSISSATGFTRITRAQVATIRGRNILSPPTPWACPPGKLFSSTSFQTA